MSDTIQFASEAEPQAASTLQPWKLLVVDDDPEVHRITRLILGSYELEGRRLEVFSAYNSKDAKDVLKANADMAVILLDVVMESEDAGLRLVKWIRDEEANDLVRIILRTGQPGAAPEKSVIRDYRINDYKSKTELTDLKLFTTVTVALRSWQDLRRIKRSEDGFRHIVAASGDLVGNRTRDRFYHGVLLHLSGILNFEEDGLLVQSEGFAVQNDAGVMRVVAATGRFSELGGKALEPGQHGELVLLVQRAIIEKRAFFAGSYFSIHFMSANGSDNVIVFSTGAHLDSMERELLRVFATNVGLMFGSLDLSEHVEATQRELLVTLGEVVESRSSETSNHVRRVGEMAAYLATACGMSARDVELIKVAAPMHDIGKMAIPDAILNKPGPLTNDEFIVMRQHTLLGAQMLKGGSGILEVASRIARSHHERWDGGGYPDGLAGDSIPLEARITAVCDVFDALYHSRVYKQAWDLETIRNFFREGRGTQFDAYVHDVFFAGFDDIMAIMERWPD